MTSKGRFSYFRILGFVVFVASIALMILGVPMPVIQVAESKSSSLLSSSHESRVGSTSNKISDGSDPKGSSTETILNSSVIDDNQKVVMINFDDGYKSHFLYAKPILDKYGFKATFFIVCGKMETKPKWMTWNHITALKNDGMDIESHTMTHAHLDSLSTQTLYYEIGYAKQCLADHGFKTTIFSYPNDLGSDNKTVINIVSKYYDLARSGGEPLFILDCNGYKDFPQTDCRRYNSEANLNYANRYDIRAKSLVHISVNGNNSSPSQAFEKFVQRVNSQTALNLNGKINAIPIIVYHNLTNSMQEYNDTGSTTSIDLFTQEMKYLHDNGFKVLILNQLGYDATDNVFYIKN